MFFWHQWGGGGGSESITREGERISIYSCLHTLIIHDSKKDGSMSILRDPLRKTDFKCLKTVIRLMF